MVYLLTSSSSNKGTYKRLVGLSPPSGAVLPRLLPSVEAWGRRRSLIILESADKVCSNCESVMVKPSVNDDEVVSSRLRASLDCWDALPCTCDMEGRILDDRDELLRLDGLLVRCSMR